MTAEAMDELPSEIAKRTPAVALASTNGAAASKDGGVTPAAEHRTVARAMSILELVLANDSDGMRLGELSAAIGAPKSSVHGLAKGLVATGYFREANGRYFAGPAVSSLIAFGPTTLPSVYHHALEELKESWNETAMIAMLVGESVVYLDAVESDAFIRAAPRLNTRLPLWPRSSGKCFLAFMEPRRLEMYLRRHQPDRGDAERVRDELAQVRAMGVAFNIGGSVEDHVGIASPIVIPGAPATVAIAVAGPRNRMKDRVDAIAERLRVTTQTMSRTSSLD